MTEFPTTRWSFIAAVQADEQTRRKLLGEFLIAYQTPLQRFLVRARGLGPDEAEEIVQGFVVDKVVLAGLLDRADRERGRLRTFLARSLTNYLLNIRRRDHRVQPLDAMTCDRESVRGASEQALDPGHAFETEWARYVLELTLSRMHAECIGTARAQLWQLFEQRLLGPMFDGQAAPLYEDLAEQLGYAHKVQAMNALVTAKRMFARILRTVVSEYADGEDGIEQEIHELKRIVSQPAHDSD